MSSLSKKRKIKSRRKFSKEEFFPRKATKEATDLYVMDSLIRNAFPDPGARETYIQALIEGMDNEPNLELRE